MLAAIGGLLVVAFVTFAVLVAGPPTAANLASSTSDGIAPTALSATDAAAGIVVPAGWVVVREDDAQIVVLSPDGAMKVRIALTADAAADLEGGVGPTRNELLASGLHVAHADLDGGGIAAAVEVPGGVVGLRSELLLDVDPASYRPAFAALLEGVRP